MRASKWLTILFVGLTTLSSCLSWAKSQGCNDALSSTVTLNEAMFRAADMESRFTSALNDSSFEVAGQAAKRLARLQVVIDSLLDRHDGDMLDDIQDELDHLAEANPKSLPTSDQPELLRVEMRPQAKKEFTKLQPYLQRKYGEFEAEVRHTGVQGLAKHWALERLVAHVLNIEEKAAYSVRLNQGYRVVMGMTDPGVLVIYYLSKTVTHFN